MKRRIAVVLVAAVLLTQAAPALAATGSGTALVGSVDVTIHGKKRIVQPPVAQCLTNGGNIQNASKRIRLKGVAEYGDGNTKCTADPSNGRITVEATGQKFELNALPEFGGPRIRISNFLATCATTVSGAVARMQFSGLVGMEAPQDLPPNYTVVVPGDHKGDPPLAKIILNEILVPSPPDGSITLNLMHVIFAPTGQGPITGELVVGSVYCTPLV
ncbi:choice-of-anchor P family protein [Actinocrispum sp. NPDC049592]|uniref:choice-of-anchor P family protein n=1 Tax=Actinocrispum sp. NPDC049592 TaxID=3154835 RepID=UPI003419D2D6